jgi:hypothetical protein
MAYQLYHTAQGEFCIDWDTCCQIIRSYYRSSAQLKHASERKESQRGLNPFSWGMPDLSYLEVDWDKVRKDTEENTLSDAWKLAAFATFGKHGIDELVSKLQQMQKETRSNTAKFNGQQRKVTQASMDSIKSSVASYQSTIDVLKDVRDTSGAALILAATVATGGAAVSAAVAGGGLKTWAAYQDTGSLGVATIEAAQNIIICVIPAARGVKLGEKVAAEKVMKVVMVAVLETDKAVLEGHELSVALQKGLAKGAGSAAGELLKGPLKKIIDRTAVPLTAKVLKIPTDVASGYLVGAAKKAVENKTKDAVGKMFESSGQTRHEIVRSRTEERSWDSVLTFADKDKLLLKFAVVDMSKGIGHSWW